MGGTSMENRVTEVAYSDRDRGFHKDGESEELRKTTQTYAGLRKLKKKGGRGGVRNCSRRAIRKRNRGGKSHLAGGQKKESMPFQSGVKGLAGVEARKDVQGALVQGT